ncbi:tripartite tricarboxylate transporter substrate binding protein [Siccirubricoccus sp. KC 17139]|uniref:Tripartite tricarboxylate transporter substrate binding protein n=1 Tax=Siccirubricoccus soli TaxID=2899147 RepID=A0ABT1DBB8_9PROT|nr:tripartite tricarboxylate transporter substrate binding protein [Siccirubricoccus soli]MCO6418469.1 tripartite tricarboxylate transporter substrate binding protein [Siccirubricoccus soli]MCP2684604.1 tripartite tricarboxylate transporter substrate binding protein [Siccirubricoccus soli]
MTKIRLGRRALLASSLAPAAAWAQGNTAGGNAAGTWPGARPIRLVIGFPPGGSADFLARTLAEPLQKSLGQTIVVDNRPGAGANIATEHVARSEADGYTILLGGNFSHAVNPAMFRRLSFDPIADFTPIGQVSDLPTIIAVSSASGIKTLAELLDRIKQKPGHWNYGTPGIGTPSHLAGAMLSRVTGFELTHVPFRGGAPSLTAVLAGDIEIIIGTPPVVLPHSRTGRLNALALTTAAPSPVIPDVPGAASQGLPALDISGWYGLFAPARLPAPIRDRLHAALGEALANPTVKERFGQEGLQAISSTSPAAFGEFVVKEMPFWAQVVRDAGATVE